MAPGLRPDYKTYRSPYGPKYVSLLYLAFILIPLA